MIVDHISNRAQYYCMGEAVRTALDFFASVGDSSLEKANLQISDDVLVKVRPMMTKPEAECSFEAHKQDADIHFVAYGAEQIGYTEVRNLKELSYDPESDMVRLEGTGDKITLNAGYFLIALPQDAHMPCIAPAEPAPLGKMIAKYRV